MADWKTVRYDPTYTEKLDGEVIPLCDALNGAEFVTVSSCSGHGTRRGTIWFEHSNDERIESMARFVLKTTNRDFCSFYVQFQKEILVDGYGWSLMVSPNEVYRSTPENESLGRVVRGFSEVEAAIMKWNQGS